MRYEGNLQTIQYKSNSSYKSIKVKKKIGNWEHVERMNNKREMNEIFKVKLEGG